MFPLLGCPPKLKLCEVQQESVDEGSPIARRVSRFPSYLMGSETSVRKFSADYVSGSQPDGRHPGTLLDSAVRQACGWWEMGLEGHVFFLFSGWVTFWLLWLLRGFLVAFVGISHHVALRACLFCRFPLETSPPNNGACGLWEMFFFFPFFLSFCSSPVGFDQ